MHLVLIKSTLIFTVEQLNIIKKNFVWRGKKENVLPYVYLIRKCKTISLQCSWIRRLSDDNFHDWKFLVKKEVRRKF